MSTQADRLRQIDRLVRLYTGGLSSIQIAKKIGRSKYWVLCQLRSVGVVRSLSEAANLAFKTGTRKRHSGADSHRWKGGKKLHAKGYVQIMVKDHPFADRGGYVLAHRLVMEKRLGRYLLPSEDVHHKNGIRTDNRIKNLEIISHSEHMSLHARIRPRDRGRFVCKS